MDETKNITTSNCILKPHKRLPQMTDCFKHFKKKILKSVHSGYWPEILDFFFLLCVLFIGQQIHLSL